LLFVLRWWPQQNLAIVPFIASIAVHRHHCRAIHHRRCCCIAIALAVLALFLADLIPRLPVGGCAGTSTSRHLPPLVRCRPPCCHLLVLFLIRRLVATLMPLPLVLPCFLSAAVLLAAVSSSSFLAAAPVVVVVDKDNNEEDNGIIHSGASAVVGIVPVVVVVNKDNNEEDDGIILSGISIVVGIVASLQAVAVKRLLQSRCPVAAAAVSVA
jgi:hypothetical protein